MARRAKGRKVKPKPEGNLAVETAGGLGGESDGRYGRYGVALVRRAIRGGWNIPAKVKQTIVADLAKIAGGAKRKARDRISAARVLVSADANDLRSEADAVDAGRPIAPTAPVNVDVNVQVGQQAQAPQIDLTRLSDEQLANLDDIARALGSEPSRADPGTIPAVDQARTLPA